jgi:organic radical activating enzyme
MNNSLDPWALPLLAQWPKVLQVVKGEIPVPAVAEVFITNHCDFHCPHCRFKTVHGTQDDHMSVAEFDSLLAELSAEGVSNLELSGGGESLDHPQIDEILAVIATRKFRIGLITNGYKLVERPELIGDLLPIADWIASPLTPSATQPIRSSMAANRSSMRDCMR